jgi:branched-subunit amino acid aminotransferase/4-amino-4-deoxychorismate lyase
MFIRWEQLIYLHSIFVGMAAANFLFYNGSISKTGKPLLLPDNRSFRYGDGFFETMKMVNGKLVLEELHLERLFRSLETMQFQQPDYFTADYLREQVLALAKKNYHDKLARVRITIFRGEGGLYDVQNHFPHHLIQTWPLESSINKMNENGLVAGIFKDGRKVCDTYSSIKHNNYLPYVMGALWAKKQRMNEAIILNPYDRVADATIANVFIVKDGTIKTPPLSEGCVNGVMRKYLLDCFKKENIPHEIAPLQPEDLLQASEIFLTNAISGMKWVKQLDNSEYDHQLSAHLYRQFILPLQ